MPKYNQTIDQPLSTTEGRRYTPLYLASMACGAGALVALLLGLLAERPWAELWRWLAIGAGLPLLILFIAATAPLIVWLADNLPRRDSPQAWGAGGAEPETIRLLPVRAQTPRIRLAGADDGYTEEDLRRLIEIAYGAGYAVRDFLGTTLPSGRRIANYDSDLRPFFDMLVKAGLLVERSQRNKGRLLGDLDAALNLFGLL